MFLTHEKARGYLKKSGYNTRSILKVAESENEGNVFLSHCSSDMELLGGVVEFLESHGANVYIDKLDFDLPAKTSPDTAKILKQRIKEIPRFIVLVTPNTSASKWVPWELGLADALLGSDCVATLPLLYTENDNSNWTTQEYLAIYQRIGLWEYEPTGIDTWLVEYPDRKSGTPLINWLTL